MKGHAKEVDVDRARDTEGNKQGNDGANAPVFAGAWLHEVPSEVLEAINSRKLSAVLVQQMMLAVLKAGPLADNNWPNDASTSNVDGVHENSYEQME